MAAPLVFLLVFLLRLKNLDNVFVLCFAYFLYIFNCYTIICNQYRFEHLI